MPGFMERIGFLEPDFDHEWAKGERARHKANREAYERRQQGITERRERAARAGCQCHSCYEIRAMLEIPQPERGE